MILVDSSVWIDYFRGTATAQAVRLDDLLGTVPIAVGDLILTEVLQGFGLIGVSWVNCSFLPRWFSLRGHRTTPVLR